VTKSGFAGCYYFERAGGERRIIAINPIPEQSHFKKSCRNLSGIGFPGSSHYATRVGLLRWKATRIEEKPTVIKEGRPPEF